MAHRFSNLCSNTRRYALKEKPMCVPMHVHLQVWALPVNTCTASLFTVFGLDMLWCKKLDSTKVRSNCAMLQMQCTYVQQNQSFWWVLICFKSRQNAQNELETLVVTEVLILFFIILLISL